MTRSTAADSRALDVLATPTTALSEASIRTEPRVLTEAPLGTERPAVTQLIVVDTTVPSHERLVRLVTQVYRTPASSIRGVQSWESLAAELSGYSRIDDLVVVTHSVFDAVQIAGVQRTASQIVEVLKHSPPVGAVTFEGCVFGRDLSGMHEVATKLGIGSVRGWTYWHAFDRWAVVPTGDREAAVAAFGDAAARASPYLPKDVLGVSTYSVAEQEKAFAASSLDLASEYFVESLYQLVPSFDKPSFEKAVLEGLLDAVVHRTRGSAEMRVIDSAGAQSALETELGRSRPIFARVVVTPW